MELEKCVQQKKNLVIQTVSWEEAIETPNLRNE
jgi:hypothetical protein